MIMHVLTYAHAQTRPGQSLWQRQQQAVAASKAAASKATEAEPAEPAPHPGMHEAWGMGQDELQVSLILC